MESKKALSGGTGTMVSLAASVFLQNHGRFGSEHPSLVVCLYILTGLLLLFTLFQFKPLARLFGLRPITNDGPPEPTVHAESGISVVGNPVGSNLSRIGDIYGTDALTATLEHERRVAAAMQPAPAPPPLPCFSSYARFIHAEYGCGIWVKVNERTQLPHKMAVCFFENPSGTDDRRGIAVKHVEARLNFRGALEPTHVKTAYWLDEEANQIDIHAGHHVAVIIGYLKGVNQFITYENKWSFPNQSGFGGWPCSEGMHVPLSATSLIVEIFLVERKDQRTVARAIVEIDAPKKTIKTVES